MRKGNSEEIAKILLTHGEELFNATRAFTPFTGNTAADELINDLENYPHAYVIACIMDRQVKAEVAWLIPYELSKKLGGFSFKKLKDLSPSAVGKLLSKPKPLHRFPNKMGKDLYLAIQLIKDQYKGDASAIWNDMPNSAEVVYRFMQFQGVGPKIATMATNILARRFKIKFSDYYSIDISVDIHIRRVFQRLGLVSESASTEELIYRARSLSPEFPGMLDFPCWEIGREWCRPQKRHCEKCYMEKVCPKI